MAGAEGVDSAVKKLPGVDRATIENFWRTEIVNGHEKTLLPFRRRCTKPTNEDSALSFPLKIPGV